MHPIISKIDSFLTPALPGGNPLEGSNFEKIPRNIISLIQNYIEPTQIAQKTHLINSEFRYIWGNDGHLDLSNSNITDEGLARIIQEYKKCGKLISINLTNCKNITDAGLAHVAKDPVEYLDVSSTPITHPYLAQVAHAPVEHPDSENNNITDVGLTHFTNAPVEHLDLSENNNITDYLGIIILQMQALPILQMLL